jgi:hypothetical protein
MQGIGIVRSGHSVTAPSKVERIHRSSLPSFQSTTYASNAASDLNQSRGSADVPGASCQTSGAVVSGMAPVLGRNCYPWWFRSANRPRENSIPAQRLRRHYSCLPAQSAIIKPTTRANLSPEFSLCAAAIILQPISARYAGTSLPKGTYALIKLIGLRMPEGRLQRYCKHSPKLLPSKT